MRPKDVEITTTTVTTEPVTTLHLAFYGITGDDGRFTELVDLIDRWAEDAMGIEEVVHRRETHVVPVRSPRRALDQEGEQ